MESKNITKFITKYAYIINHKSEYVRTFFVNLIHLLHRHIIQIFNVNLLQKCIYHIKGSLFNNSNLQEITSYHLNGINFKNINLQKNKIIPY